MKRPFKTTHWLPYEKIGSFERVKREFGLSNGHRLTVEYDIRREARGSNTIDFYRCSEDTLAPTHTHSIDTIYDIEGYRINSVEKRLIQFESFLGYEEVWVVKGDEQEVQFIDKDQLKTISQVANSVHGAPESVLHEVVSTKLETEDQVREFLEGRATEYGFELCGNLDIECNGKRGDYRARYLGKEIILEVERDVKDFINHDHRTDGIEGWANPGSIDVIFAASDKDNLRERVDVPVVLAGEELSSWLELE